MLGKSYEGSVILHGSSPERNLEEAYKISIGHMLIGAQISAEDIKRYVASNTYPNFLLIQKQAESNEISVDEARSVLEFLSQQATLPGKRAVIIERFENMSRNAANAILKILEEPPLDTVLILTTSKLLSILPTIRSRCLKIKVTSEKLSPLNYENPLSYVCDVLSSRNLSFEQSRIEGIVKFLDSDRNNIMNFVKQIQQEDLPLVQETILLYAGYICSKNASVEAANSFLELNSLLTLSKNTYPDNQSLTAACVCLLAKN